MKLNRKTCIAPGHQKNNYLLAIYEWKSRKTLSLDNVHKLYGKSLQACLITPRRRAHSTGFEKMMGALQPHPFIPRYPPKSIAEDLAWWTHTLSLPSLSREIPGGRNPMLEDSQYQLICWHWDICPFVVDFDDPPHPTKTVLLNVMLPPQRQAFPPTNSPDVNRRRGLRKVTR